MRSTLLLFLFLCSFTCLHAQTDSIPSAKSTDSLILVKDSSLNKQKNTYYTTLNLILSENRFLNSKARPMPVTISLKKVVNKNFLFYSIFFTVLFFALLKTFYSRYFNNVFRVFFNTSLRQSQLTDQLIQAKLPSLFFNIFFVLTAGFYIFLLLCHLGHVQSFNDIRILAACIGLVTMIYIGKYVVLKFTGWISGYTSEADTYIFIIFLINKIIAIVLLPVIIIMAFSQPGLVTIVVFISYLIIVLMLLLRFFRSYGILQNRIKVQRFHFFLYIIGIEILPLLLIYKYTLNLLTIYL